MKQSILKLAVAGGLFTLLSGILPALAQDAGAHKGHDMSMMKSAGATGTIPVNAVINKIDTDKSSINVTHDPIPALKWPTMTMDMTVTKRVDLSKLKPGSSVILSLKQGRDKQYRVIEVKPRN